MDIGPSHEHRIRMDRTDPSRRLVRGQRHGHGRGLAELQGASRGLTQDRLDGRVQHLDLCQTIADRLDWADSREPGDSRAHGVP